MNDSTADADGHRLEACATDERRGLGACPAGERHRLEACATLGLHGFDPLAELDVRERNLPHWRQPGATCFVTFRLADSLPQSAIEELRDDRRRWLGRNPVSSPDRLGVFQRLFSERIETLLHAGYGDCVLGQPRIAGVVESALRHFHGQRYLLDDYVIMPNHVHAIVTPNVDRELSDILHSWKSFSANQMNRVLGRSGRLWQDESYDHIVRDEEELVGYRQYIAANPAKAGLTEGHYRLGAGRGVS